MYYICIHSTRNSKRGGAYFIRSPDNFCAPPPHFGARESKGNETKRRTKRCGRRRSNGGGREGGTKETLAASCVQFSRLRAFPSRSSGRAVHAALHCTSTPRRAQHCGRRRWYAPERAAPRCTVHVADCTFCGNARCSSAAVKETPQSSLLSLSWVLSGPLYSLGWRWRQRAAAALAQEGIHGK